MDRPLGHPPEDDAVDQLTLKIKQTTVGDASEHSKSMEISDKSKIVEVVDLTKEVWEKIKSSSNINHIKLKPNGLFPNDAKTRAVLKEVLNNIASVELSYDISSQSMKNIWALGFRFTILQLNISTLNTDNQIKVLKTINSGICDLRLILHEPNQKVLDTLSSCFRSLKVLNITYAQTSKLKTSPPTICSLEVMKISFKGQGDMVRFTNSKPIKNSKNIMFDGIEDGVGLEKNAVPCSSKLTLFSSQTAKSLLEAHFENATIIGFRIRKGYWDEWAIGRDLQQLQGLILELSDEHHDYSTSGFSYPQVTSLVIKNITRVDNSFFAWIARGFPRIKYLALNSSSQIPDLSRETFSFQFALPNLLRLRSDIKLNHKIYADLISLSPDIKEMDIPAGKFTVHEDT
ncbi:hypothetical protein DSO57_1038153 [Entomophthora muscae]|uniref:Uncharacterized protein n=1 Tax=Entomophthora muscae TaxID=34485 RepID=A0ACC2T9S4_9FUNG|nr:hypothetical protein DSO57_1038153 [Entomophthora muscae]